MPPLAMLDAFKGNLNAQAWLWKDHTGHAEAAQITALADKARQGIESAFAAEGITARCSGRESNAIPRSSMGAVHFPHDPATACDSPDKADHLDEQLAREIKPIFG